MRLLVTLTSLAFCNTAWAGVVYFVSPVGNDSNDGSELTPWRTIQHGLNQIQPGDTLEVGEGTYAEFVKFIRSGNPLDGPITLHGNNAVLDYSGVPAVVGDVPAIEINSQSYLTVSEFEIRNLKANQPSAVPIGIFIHGASHHIDVIDNTIHSIENNLSRLSNAHGIAVYGTGTTQAEACHDITIMGNELHSLKLGASECLVVNGNVDGFLVAENMIHHCNNIGIDAIGFERVSTGTLDQARNGEIRDNIVSQIDSRGNPAYGQERSAGGIYVDGGKFISIHDNTIAECNIGIELASEHKGRATSFITVQNNLVHGCHIAGLAMGGFNKKRGSTQNCLIENNTFRENDTDEDGNGELLIQFQVRNNIIRNNTIWATDQNLMISNPFKTSDGNRVDGNTYYAPGGVSEAIFQWNGKRFKSFSKYKQKTRNDSHSTLDNPPLDSQ